MKPSVLLSLWVVVLASCVQGKPQDGNYVDSTHDNEQYMDDYYSDYNETDDYPEDDDASNDRAITENVNFVNQGQTITVDKGTTIRLPCYVDEFPKDYVIMWKKISDDDNGSPNILAV